MAAATAPATATKLAADEYTAELAGVPFGAPMGAPEGVAETADGVIAEGASVCRPGRQHGALRGGGDGEEGEEGGDRGEASHLVVVDGERLAGEDSERRRWAVASECLAEETTVVSCEL
ncbi:hypothetical protein TRIUR3_23590 [Triticum urartu]|uniref:Uncharacterized protein n=1 Tax=Triticum urartu TaxID=4572 RepID=M7Z6Y9_TRIUA|nr:hypothetical protein TRIUR3_23590 [Triticum urartu]